MKPCYILLMSVVVLPGLLYAQIPTSAGRNSIRLGIDLTSLNAPGAVGLRYVVRLARHFGNDRVVVAAEAGYLRITSANLPFNDVDPGPNRRERFTADVTAFYDVLPQPNHALRLGLGVSAWYRRDDIYRGASAILNTVGLQGVAIDRVERNGINTGVHFATEYEWLFDRRWGMDARLRLVNLEGTGFSSMVGLGISHRF